VRVGAAGLPAGAAADRDLSFLGWTDVTDLSSDGRLLLFIEHGYRSGVREGPEDMYLWRMDAPLPVRLGKGMPMALSPDGKWAMSVQDDGLVLVPTGPGASRPLPHGALAFYGRLSWLPDGRRVVFSANGWDHEPRCYVQDVEGGPPKAITPEGVQTATIRTLLPTPDGRFVAAEDAAHRLALYPIDGGEAKPLPGILPGDDPIQWSADGRWLYVRGPGKFPARVYRVDHSTGRREFWKDLMPPDPTAVVDVSDMVGRVLLTPDGRSYVYSYIRWQGEIQLLGGLM
jgi:eukaryotic-like serine/threonine-protein kinase